MHACCVSVFKIVLYLHTTHSESERTPPHSFAATPLAMIQSVKQGEPDYAQWEQWGYDILTTGIFTIIICATLGLLLIHFTSTRFLEMVRKLLVFVERCGVGKLLKIRNVCHCDASAFSIVDAGIRV